jgi:hypothetical protein
MYLTKGYSLTRKLSNQIMLIPVSELDLYDLIQFCSIFTTTFISMEFLVFWYVQ